eukprot:gene363-421_t
MTPVIVDLFGEGSKDIVLVNSENYIDVISGATGERAIGWPLILPVSSFSASPVVYDVDNDGFAEIIVATRDAEILFIRSFGMVMHDTTLRIPPLKVLKSWAKDLTGKHVDASFSLHNNGVDKTRVSPHDTSKTPFNPDDRYVFNTNLAQKYDIDDILYSSQYERYIHSDRTFSNKSDAHIWMDAHIFAAPVVADIDLDGIMELIVPVSYYFDQEYYQDPAHMSKMDQDVDLTQFVAGGIVCFNLQDFTIKWQTHLDLTTDMKTFNGYLYNSPTVVNLVGDSRLEIAIGSGIGYVYVLDHLGNEVSSSMMDSIYSQVVTEDLNSDGVLEMVVSDSRGNVVCFNNHGEEIWSQKIPGMTESAVSIGDIDGDGVLDVVVGSFEGGIYAWNGVSGDPLPHFPVKTPKDTIILSSILLVDLSTGPRDTKNGLTIVVHATDGVLYAIDGKEGCVNKLDIGYSSGTADILGSEFTLSFEIIDETIPSTGSTYKVKISYGGKMLYTEQYGQPGVKSITLPTPQRSYLRLLTIEMTNNLGQSFIDSVAYSFNWDFARLLKWVIVLPFAITTVLILIVQQGTTSKIPLPQ